MRTSDEEHTNSTEGARARDDKIVVRETAIGVFRRPAAAFAPGVARSSWVEEDTEEHDVVEGDDGQDGQQDGRGPAPGPDPGSYESRRQAYEERMAYYTREFDRIR